MRPIDLQALIPRSYEVNRANSINAARPEMQQQQFVKQLDKEIQHEEQFVKESGKTEKGVVDKDARNKNKHNGKEKGQQNQGKKNEPAARALAEHKSTSMLDIKV
jgi:hypothetical protein